MGNKVVFNVSLILVIICVVTIIVSFISISCKKKPYKILGVSIFIFIITFPFLINESYLYIVKNPYNTAWDAADILSFYGSFLAFIGTVVLGILALWQNKKIRIESKRSQKKLEELNRLSDETNEKLMLSQIQNQIPFFSLELLLHKNDRIKSKDIPEIDDGFYQYGEVKAEGNNKRIYTSKINFCKHQKAENYFKRTIGLTFTSLNDSIINRTDFDSIDINYYIEAKKLTTTWDKVKLPIFNYDIVTKGDSFYIELEIYYNYIDELLINEVYNPFRFQFNINLEVATITGLKQQINISAFVNKDKDQDKDTIEIFNYDTKTILYKPNNLEIV